MITSPLGDKVHDWGITSPLGSNFAPKSEIKNWLKALRFY
jgi:hypothetical protein